MKVAVVGTGLMGRPMAERLIQRGHPVTAYNRTRAKVEPLVSLGAKLADSPAAAIEDSECVLLMLSDARAIREVINSRKPPVSLSRRTVIQMGTIAPEESQTFQKQVGDMGGDYFECPVLGSVAEAGCGQLILMVGGSPQQFDQWGEFLEVFGPDPYYIGPVGYAAALKLAMNQLIGSLMTAFAQSLGLVQRYGIDEQLFLKVLMKSALFAPMFEKKMPRLLTRDYDHPNFPLKHLVKDINLFVKTAESINLPVTGLEGVRRILEQTLQKSFESKDYSCLYETVNPQKSKNKR